MAEISPWIAIVDDDPSVLKALSRLLRTHAYHAKTYESAHKFLAALRGPLPECLVVDWQMPEMNGVELLEHMTRQGIEVPTIMISAHSDPSARQRRETGRQWTCEGGRGPASIGGREWFLSLPLSARPLPQH